MQKQHSIHLSSDIDMSILLVKVYRYCIQVTGFILDIILGNVVSKHHQDLQSHGQMQKAKMFKKAIIKLMLEYDFDE